MLLVFSKYQKKEEKDGRFDPSCANAVEAAAAAAAAVFEALGRLTMTCGCLIVGAALSVLFFFGFTYCSVAVILNERYSRFFFFQGSRFPRGGEQEIKLTPADQDFCLKRAVES